MCYNVILSLAKMMIATNRTDGHMLSYFPFDAYDVTKSIQSASINKYD
jgi:hypothetical protein